MRDEEICKHPYFLSVSETSPYVISLSKGELDIVKNYYFRNQLETGLWEKAAIVYPKNVRAAKNGILFSYFKVEPDGKGTPYLLSEAPSWFQELYQSFAERCHSEWKLRLIIND